MPLNALTDMLPPPALQQTEEDKQKAMENPMGVLAKLFAPKPIETTGRRTEVREEEEEDINDFSRGALRGFFTQDVPLPSQQIEQFNQKFKQSYSPARETLANFMRGFAASTTGKKFVSLREQKFAEFAADIQAKQEDAKSKASLALQAMQEVRMQRAVDQANDWKKVEQAENDREYWERKDQFEASYGNQAANTQIRLAELNQRLKEFQIAQGDKERPKNVFDNSYLSARSNLLRNGVDVDTIEGRQQLQADTLANYEAYEKRKAKNKPSAQWPAFKSSSITTIDGRQVIGYFGGPKGQPPTEFGTVTSSGEILPGFMQPESTPGERISWNAGQMSVQNLRTAAESVQDVKNFGGLLGTDLGIKMRNLFGEAWGIPLEERQTIAANRSGIIDFVTQKTGAQFSDKERGFTMVAMPQTINNPHDFINATSAILGPTMSSMIGKQFPQFYQRVDMIPYIKELRDDTEKMFLETLTVNDKQVKKNKVRFPTYNEFLESVVAAEQAKGNQFNIIRDKKSGVIIGII